MTDIPSIRFRELLEELQKLGFKKIRQKGSHIRFHHPDGRKTTIPDHGSKDVPQGLLIKVIKHDLEMDVRDFFKKQ